MWAAFPGVGLWPLAWVGAGLWALAVRGTTVGRAFALGTATGVACFLPLLSWSGIYVGVLPWFALAVFESLYVGAAAALFTLAVRRPRCTSAGRRLAEPAWAAAAWVAAEFARATTPWGGFPWARLAFSQADSPLVGLAALGGAPLVSFAVVLVGSAVALALPVHRVPSTPRGDVGAPAGTAADRAGGRGKRAGSRGRRSGGRPTEASPDRATRTPLAAVSGVALLALLPVGLAASVPRPTGGPPVRVLLVQGNVPQAGLDFNAQRRAVLDNHVRGTLQAAAEVAAGTRPRPDVVIWPENASDIDPLRESDAAAQIRRATAAIGVPVLVGAVLEEPVGRLTNAALLYDTAGNVTERYDKRHPVPFAEYIPWRPFFRLFSPEVDRVSRDFVGGDRLVLFTVPVAAGGDVRLGPNICFEVAHDDLVRDGVAEGASMIVVQTNNATFGLSDESVQQLAISRLRAVEHGRSVVHNSNVGVSALITPDGHAHGRTELFTPALVDLDLPRRTDLTPATRLGPWPELLITLAAALGAVGGLLRGRT